MKGTLYIQREKGRRIEKPEALECEIDVRRGKIAIASVGSTVKARLHRAQVDFISANGLRLSGVEEHGIGLGQLLHYQEWWFVPVVSSKE